MIEYVMLQGDTSTLECAHQLGKLCEGRHLVVNLIPYNQTNVKDKLKCPPKEHLAKFRDIVASYGTFCTIRRTMGADIDSACGQLITLRKTKEEETKDDVVRDIEDVATDKRLGSKEGVARVVSSKSGKVVDDVAVEKATVVLPAKTGLDRWIVPLATATAVSASLFVGSAIFFLRQRRR